MPLACVSYVAESDSQRPPPTPARLAVLVSGRGSHLRNLSTAIQLGRLPAKVVLVASDRPHCPALQHAAELGLPCWSEQARREPDRLAWDRRLFAAIAAAAPDWVLLAGFMRVLDGRVLGPWQDRMLNIHPSLLPRWPGLDTHRRAIEAGDREHGASLHLVTAELDAGPVLARVRLAIRPDDTPQSLAARLLPLEHRLVLDGLGLLLSGRVRVQQGVFSLDGRVLAEPLELDADALADAGSDASGAAGPPRSGGV